MIAAVAKRLDRLEASLATALLRREGRVPDRVHMRVISSCIGGGPPDLAKSWCTRYVAEGKLFEVVHIAGEPNELTPEQLEQFISGFPVEWR